VGRLSKEAALDVLRVRERLIKKALATEAAELCDRILQKEAGFFGRLTGGAKTVAKGGSGLWSRLRRGGLTPQQGGGATTWSDVGSNLLKMLGVAGLSAGATAGATALWRHRKDQALKGDIERSYKQMFTEFPDLETAPPERVRAHFGVVTRVAPSLAADPIVAGSLLKQTVERNYFDPATVKALAETQRRIDEMHEKRSPFSPHLDHGLSLAHRVISPLGGIQ
jgi:hypothetical protein